MTESFQRKKIVLLGGGIASLTTAYELTSVLGWENLYEITIYQMGWRLGGKCASGRNMTKHSPFHEPDYRIQEHGLHIFLGFYENAFRMLKKCYDELGKDGPFSSIEDGFKPHNLIVLEEYIKDHWVNLYFDFPTNDLKPWEGGPIVSLWDHITTTLKFIEQTYSDINLGKPDSPKESNQLLSWIISTVKQLELGVEICQFLSEELLIYFPEQIISSLLNNPEFFWSELENLATYLIKPKNQKLISEEILIKIAYNFAVSLRGHPKTHRKEHHQLILKLLDKFQQTIGKLLDFELEQDDDTVWRLRLIDLAMANIQGLFIDEVIYHRCLPDLDRYDYRDWLRKHGAREASVNSAFIRVLYDLVYAFPEGNTANPQLGAGTAIRILTTMIFQYNGSIMWKMQGAMGDVVITPLYQLLKRRGVKFEFFHKVKQLHLNEAQNAIKRITLERQVNLKNPDQEYNPLIKVKQLLCWPSEPLYEQINPEEAKQLQAEHINLESNWSPWQNVETIELNSTKGDFDIVVLGISLAALPSICEELLQVDPQKNPASQRWHAMFAHIKTVTTQGGQLWLKPTLSQLGWQGSSPVLGAYVEPLDVYADMSDLIPKENWSSEHYPYNCAYFTGVIPDPGIPPTTDYDFPSREQEKIKQQTIYFMENHIGHLWPNATTPENPQGLNWNLLVDYKNQQGVERLDSQYWRINIDPSERYILSVPNSTQYRLKTDESGFNNLYLAGDWIDNGYNSGAVEPTVISGMQATRAILEQKFNIKYSKKIIREWDDWI